ncbi:MAG: Holliday junction resolvase RuvX [Microthrixaceae bacterium]|nr:Holliday junction resolvase RuvX [Microthrixaceae bacterium]MCB1010075.1 Holliday junction resolvase RuvX [Microthrixaceae bacterium]MCB9386491.1 Holliday junction resolvase RuvX [Microthrixaceae bacterium]MCO5320139.1 Holliday junction resolvase RuvX [Microthrixaceae bacterium]
MRSIGLDLGSVRIGVAVSDSEGTLALPSATLERGADWGADHAAIAELVDEAEAEIVVVGLPLSLDGSEGPAARRTRKEVARLGRALAVPVRTYDERLSTVHAQRMLHDAGFDTAGSRRHVDSSAAAVILQGWLDQTRTEDHEDPHPDVCPD